MALLTAANATPIPWNLVQQPDLSTDSSGTITPGANTAGYQPTMALAQNHVHFMGVSGLPAGSVKIFVIHCMFPTPRPVSLHLTTFETFFFFLIKKKQSHTCNPLHNQWEISQPPMVKRLLSS